MEYDDHDEEDVCQTCGGDGLSSWHQHPELWGEDACTEEDYPIACPRCCVEA